MQSISVASTALVPIIFWLSPFLFKKLQSLGSLSERSSYKRNTLYRFSCALIASTNFDVDIVNT